MNTSASKKSGAAAADKDAMLDERPAVAPEQRQRDIEIAAYFLAEKRGFVPDAELDDWLLAEAQVAKQYFDSGLL